jgi:hypothetical protein
MLSLFGEAIIFTMLGVGLYNADHSVWSVNFTLGQFLIIIIARLATVYIVNYSFSCCYPRTFSFKEISFINFSGCIKGAICYGLSLEVAHEHVWTFKYEDTMGNIVEDISKSKMKESIVNNTVLLNVIVTTLLFGSLMNLARRCLLGSDEEREIEISLI